ncbi:MAG: tetratricopeptide repeat protein, partial [bacterium]
MAGLYISTGQYEKAAEIYREAYRRDRHKTDGLLVLADAALWKQDPQLAEDMLLKARKIHGPDRTLDLKLAEIYLQTEQQDKVIQVYQNLNKQGMLKLEDKLKLLQYYIWFGRMGDFYDWGMKLPLAEIPGEYLIPLYQIARQRWDYREAAGILEQRAKSEESKDTLLLERYKLEKDFGNIEESLRLARQLYHKNPNLGNYLELTSLYSADQSLDQLLDLQEKRFLANPNDFKLAEELYNNYYWNKDTGRGIKYLNSVLASHPGNIPVLTFLGRLHYLTKEFAQAASYYQQIGREKLGNIELEQLIFIYHIQKDWPRKLAALQELYRRLPNAPILLRVARTRILMKDFPGALALYRRYLNEHSGNLLAKMEYVSLLEKTGKKKEANIQLDAIKKRKLTPTQLLSFARFTYEIKSFSHSRWAYMKLLRQNDKPDEALLRMGLMANSEDKYLEAVSYYKRYLAYFPPNPIVLFYLAEIRFQQNNMVEANRYYQKAEALLSEKRNPDLFEAQMRAKATYRLGKREQAFNMYQELIKKYPLDQSSLMDYLELLVEDRSYETALLEIKKRRPKPELRLTQIESRIYQELGNHDQAIKLLKEAEKKYPDKIWIKMRIASNYFLWGKRVNSLYYLQEAEKLHPADKYYLTQDKANTLKDY